MSSETPKCPRLFWSSTHWKFCHFLTGHLKTLTLCWVLFVPILACVGNRLLLTEILIFILLSCLVQPLVQPRELRLPRMSHKAINRWFVAVTLLRNPSLIKYRRQGGVRPIVHLYGNINNDSNALLI